ncbi:MAG TPA: response regulator [Anaerolineales bacterium]|nr:response regulator [Anaerolineales bacterium]
MDSQQGYLLVVDDIPDILNLLKATLTFKGYRVVTARDGVEAMEMIGKEMPALIIADILMPKMDGFTLVHYLRLDPETRDIPIVFLSATYVALEDRNFALAIGVTRFLEKPVDLEAFLPLISELLTKKVPDHGSMSDREFYEGYLKRLETKLHHKNVQIARSEHLLETLPEEEKPTIQSSLQHALGERDEIMRLLDAVRDRMNGEV